MSEHLLFYDLETTGLPKKNKGSISGYYPPEEIEYYNECRMVSIAWMIFDSSGNKIKSDYIIAYPDGYKSSEKALEIHGISDEIAKRDGVDINEIFSRFGDDLIKCNRVLGYNINFDYHILMSECYRNNNRNITKILKTMYENQNVICVQQMSKKIVGVNNLIARYKLYPRLEEVYRQLFNDPEFNTSHNALDDTQRCSDIYFKLLDY